MRCPNCGEQIPEGALYCEQCGEDIHIVPDFEPEVELNIEQTISGIAEDIKEEQDANTWDNEAQKNVRWKGSRLIKSIFILAIIGVVCLPAVVGAIYIHQYNSLEIQTDKAKQCVENKEYDKAIEYYKRALEISDDDISIMFKLAEIYFLKNNKIEYEYVLSQIIGDSNATQEQIESAYGKLIAIYRARKDFKSINELLLESDNEQVMRTYQNYVAMPPEFSIQEGYYTDIQPLKLTAYGAGKIYYTVDGSMPDENSAQYIAPIIMDDGEYTICAYFVNELGIASDYVFKTYHVEIELLPNPSVGTVSGDYNFPTNIEIVENDQEIYYTTDGSTPTLSSTPYTAPIPMPLGKSYYKFVRIDGGRTSEVVERKYNLVMNTEYTPQDAEKDVVAYSIQSGKIYDEAGHAVGVSDMYMYQYQYVTNINGIDDFYVISELIQREGDAFTKTGNYFAVNAYNAKIYKLKIDEFNNYTLVEIEEQSVS